MIIEVVGVSTDNKGAELMLVAIRQHFAHRKGGVQLAVTPGFGSFADRAQYGLYQKVHISKWGRSLAAFKLMPPSFRQSYGMVIEPEVGAVLDASGFAFGDQLPERRTRAFAEDVMRWKGQGKPVVLLPQALGPFRKPGMKDLFRRVVDHTDLICAREQASYDHVVEAVGSSEKVRIAPDITIGIEVPSYADIRPEEGVVLIVPNSRMQDKMPPEQARRYVPFLAQCFEAAESAGLVPRLLLHDAVEDHKVGEALQREMGRPIPIVRETDPLRLKAVIGQAHLLIGSRFHALVGALSQAVPAIAAGWSHKYDMLMNDFGTPGAMLKPDASPEQIRAILQQTLADRDAIVGRLRTAKQRMTGQLDAMWRDVDAVLGVAAEAPVPA